MKIETKLMITVLLAIILLAILIAITGCDKHEGFAGDHNTTNIEGLINDYKVVVIDSCEYIVYDARKGYNAYGFMAHKGNCRFCEARRKTIDIKNLKFKFD